MPIGDTHVINMDDVAVNRKRGGEVRTLLSPATVKATAGFMGTIALEPGESVSEHYHPYSEEFLFLVEGEITVRLDGVESLLSAGSGVFIPMHVRHRVHNHSGSKAFGVFHLGPLAPRPELGHVDTEPLPAGEPAQPS